MHPSVLDWIAAQLPLISGPRVCELGSLDVNGSVRPLVAVLKPAEYVGVDLRPGPGVDIVGDVCAGVLESRHGDFDIVISTETLEHVQTWPLFLDQAKRLARPGGHVLLTCRSPGFPRHDHPADYWRFTESDLEWAFGDFDIFDLRSDPDHPGVFLDARRPAGWTGTPAPRQQFKIARAPD